jgi:hypothetical protein
MLDIIRTIGKTSNGLGGTKKITQPQSDPKLRRKKSYDVILAYWSILILATFFIIMGGHLDFESWLVTLRPPVSVPFTWLITPFIILGILVTFAAWLGYPLKGLPRPKTPLSQYNPFRRKKQETQEDEKTN